MSELLNQYVDSSFLDVLVSLSPAVGAGLIIGFMVAILGWVFGLVIRLGKVEM